MRADVVAIPDGTQLDLFGQVESALDAERRGALDRRRNALTCLRVSHPRALELLIGRRLTDRGEVKCGLTRPWAYSVRTKGLYFEDYRTWGGWYARPAHLLTWDELDELTAPDPRLDAVRAWSDSLTAPDAWKDRGRPYELWADPHSWHPDHIEGDHQRPGWLARLAAWTAVLAILHDAESALLSMHVDAAEWADERARRDVNASPAPASPQTPRQEARP